MCEGVEVHQVVFREKVGNGIGGGLFHVIIEVPHDNQFMWGGMFLRRFKNGLNDRLKVDYKLSTRGGYLVRVLIVGGQDTGLLCVCRTWPRGGCLDRLVYLYDGNQVGVCPLESEASPSTQQGISDTFWCHSACPSALGN